jgi:ribose-phosphate pyrophosphokinase
MHDQALILAGDSHPALAARLAAASGIPQGKTVVSSFADGETRIEIESDVSRKTAIVVQSTCTPVDHHLLVLALLADAARAAAAARVIAVIPYFGYARQDQRRRPGDPRSAQVVARLLNAVAIDAVVTIDLHTPALESALAMPALVIPATDIFLSRLGGRWPAGGCIVSPDAGGIKRAQQFASALAQPLTMLAKQRTAPDQPSVEQLLGDVQGKPCLIIDDMASTGRTLQAAARALAEAGATEIHAVFTHAVLAASALERLLDSPIRSFLTSDTIPVQDLPSRFEVVPTAGAIARALQEYL